MSRPTRGVWIEMGATEAAYSTMAVTPHTGRVD